MTENENCWETIERETLLEILSMRKRFVQPKSRHHQP